MNALKEDWDKPHETLSNPAYGLQTKQEIKMVEYWQNFFFGVFIDKDPEKKNNAGIQPSWQDKFNK